MNARVYYNTGFNSIDIPLEPDMLNNPAIFEFEDLEALDILQPTELSTISVAIQEQNARKVDMLCLDNNVYYIVNGYRMTSANVADFFVSMSYALTIGGYYNQEFTDGVIERSTSASFSTVTGAPIFEEGLQDPLLTPNHTARHLCYSMYNAISDGDKATYYTAENRPAPAGSDVKTKFDGSYEGYNIYVSPYARQTAAEIIEVTNAPITIDKTETKDIYSVNYQNQTHLLGKPTNYKTTVGTMLYQDFEQPQKYEYPGGTFYDESIMSTALALYGYGIPNPITDAYIIPKGFVHADLDSSTGVYNEIISSCLRCRINDNVIEIVADKKEEALPYIYHVYKNIANTCMVIKITAIGSGESAITKPQFLTLNSDDIDVYMICDPTPTGAPFFKIGDRMTFENSGTFPYGFSLKILAGAVRGGNWQRIPVTFSGYGYNKAEQYNRYNLTTQAISLSNASAINDALARTQAGVGLVNDAFSILPGVQNAYNAQNSINDMSLQLNNMQLQQSLKPIDTNVYNNNVASMQNSMTNAAQNATIGLASNAINSLGSMATRSIMTRASLDAQHAQTVDALRRVSYANTLFGIENTALQYDVHFNSIDSMQALVGNGVLVEIRTPDLEDVERYISIMQQYGLPTNRLLSKSGDLTDAYDNYCYIKTSGAKIARKGNQWPTRYFELAAAELDGGKRIWTVKPDRALFAEKFKVKEKKTNVV